jgi:hypothetical protein
MGFIKKIFGIEKMLYISGKLVERQETFEKVLCKNTIQLTDLKEKIEILENEIKTQDDIIFDMRKKIEKLEKSSWKGKNK